MILGGESVFLDDLIALEFVYFVVVYSFTMSFSV